MHFLDFFFFFFKETVVLLLHIFTRSVFEFEWMDLQYFFFPQKCTAFVCTHYMGSLDPENSEFHVDFFCNTLSV